MVGGTKDGVDEVIIQKLDGDIIQGDVDYKIAESKAESEMSLEEEKIKQTNKQKTEREHEYETQT